MYKYLIKECKLFVECNQKIKEYFVEVYLYQFVMFCLFYVYFCLILDIVKLNLYMFERDNFIVIKLFYYMQKVFVLYVYNVIFVK